MKKSETDRRQAVRQTDRQQELRRGEGEKRQKGEMHGCITFT